MVLLNFFTQKKKAISRRKEVTDDLATYCYQMRVSLINIFHCRLTHTHTHPPLLPHISYSPASHLTTLTMMSRQMTILQMKSRNQQQILVNM